MARATVVYVVEKPAVEPRLQHRYCLIVKQHVRKASNLAAGLRVNTQDGARRKKRKVAASAAGLVSGERTPQQRAQKAAEVAAGRFYDNASLDLPTLGAPLLAQARQATATGCQQYILCVHDQSPLHYTRHTAKTDRTTMYNKYDVGYNLASAVMLSDRDGAPLGVPYVALAAKTGVHSTRAVRPLPSRPWIDEINRTMGHLQAQGFAWPLVHIIDREADKVLHLRRFARCGRTVLIRANDVRRVQHNGQPRLLSEVEATLTAQFKFARHLHYHGKKATQYVAETSVVLTAPARLMRQRNGRVVQRTIKGAALSLRLVFAQVRDAQGHVLATWRLWTNLPASVDAATVTLWYYWRWRIESFHKLLKSAGQEIEHWQQTNVARIARRLLLAVQACVIVWALSQNETTEADNLRALLWRLSGHSYRPRAAPTAPALLAGCWNLLAIIDALDDYTVADLREHAAQLYSMLGLTLN